MARLLALVGKAHSADQSIGILPLRGEPSLSEEVSRYDSILRRLAEQVMPGVEIGRVHGAVLDLIIILEMVVLSTFAADLVGTKRQDRHHTCRSPTS